MAETMPEETATATAEELSAEPSTDEFNLEEEVLAMLEEEIGDLGAVEQPAETSEAAEVPPPPPPHPVDRFAPCEEDLLSEEFLFGADEADAQPNPQEADPPPKLPAATADIDDAKIQEQLDKEVRRQMDEGSFDAATSRYMRDENGHLLHKWKVDYAPRGGGGRAQCRDSDCLERPHQGGSRCIEKGCLRIGRRIMMDKTATDDGKVSVMWYHARCMFNTFLRARKTTRTIETEFDIEGFEALLPEDQDVLRRLIDKHEAQDLKAARFRSFDGATPEKRSAPGDAADGSAAKRQKKGKELREINKGDRVWTHFRCLPKASEGLPGGLPVAVKSKKPEVAIVREDTFDGSVIVQFESEEHEKERIAMYQTRRGKKISGWLRYPRIFEGKKQRVPLTWVDRRRDPPRLCSCTRQEWNHGVCTGISCGRGAFANVWGVAS